MALGLSRIRQVMKPRVSTTIISALSRFKTPTKPASWTTPVPRSVGDAPPGNLTIQGVSPVGGSRRDLKNTLDLPTDPGDPQRPSLPIILTALLSWRARHKKATSCLAIGFFSHCCLARLNQARHRVSDSLHRSLAALCLPEITSGVVERPFYIPTPLLVAAREAMSLDRRIG